MDLSHEATLTAIEMLTLALEDGDQARQRGAEHMAQLLHGENANPALLLRGQLNLAMVLLLALAKAQGAEDLKAGGMEWLRKFALDLSAP